MTTALGIGVLAASPLAASQQFGITAAITIAYSLIVSVLVVPPAMTVWGAYRNMRLRSTAQRWADELDQEIDAVHRRHEQEQGSSLQGERLQPTDCRALTSPYIHRTTSRRPSSWFVHVGEVPDLSWRLLRWCSAARISLPPTVN